MPQAELDASHYLFLDDPTQLLLDQHLSRLSDYVFAGGKIFINSAGMTGLTFRFGTTDITLEPMNALVQCTPLLEGDLVSVAHGGVVPDYVVSSFGARVVSTGDMTPLVRCDSGTAVSFMYHGKGIVVVGGFNVGDASIDSPTAEMRDYVHRFMPRTRTSSFFF